MEENESEAILPPPHVLSKLRTFPSVMSEVGQTAASHVSLAVSLISSFQTHSHS